VLGDDWEIEQHVRGAEMLDWRYRGPFDELPAVKGVEHRVISWTDVSQEEGTGIVHIAPGCGEAFSGTRSFPGRPVGPLRAIGFFRSHIYKCMMTAGRSLVWSICMCVRRICSSEERSRPLRPMRSKVPPPTSTRIRGFPSMDRKYPAEARCALAIGPPLPRTVTDNLDFSGCVVSGSIHFNPVGVGIDSIRYATSNQSRTAKRSTSR